MQRTFTAGHGSTEDTITSTDRKLRSQGSDGSELYVELNPPGQPAKLIIQVNGTAIGLSEVELYCLRKLLA